MQSRWRIEGRELEVEAVAEASGGFRVRWEGGEWEGSARALADGTFLIADHRGEHRVIVTPVGTQRFIRVAGEDWVCERIEGRLRRTAHGRDQDLSAPMPGVVVKLHVQVGDQVEKGAPLLTIEAMKMEHVLRAFRPGRVSEIRCVQGQMVEAGVPLVELQ